MRPPSRASPRSPSPSSDEPPARRGRRLVPGRARRAPGPGPGRHRGGFLAGGAGRGRVRHPGPQGGAAGAAGGIGALPADDRPRVGALANPVREAVEAALAERRTGLEAAALEERLRAERDDVTLPGRSRWRGSLHPLPETEREIARIFGQFGFVVVESPEVETDELNFQALNIPADHPARDLWDTIYVQPPDGRRRPGRRAPAAAHAHLAGPDPRHAPGQPADPHPDPRPLLPLRGRGRQPRLRVLPGGGPHGRRGHQHGPPARPPGRLRARHVRGRASDALPARLLPLHGALGGLRHRLRGLRRARAARPASGAAG